MIFEGAVHGRRRDGVVAGCPSDDELQCGERRCGAVRPGHGRLHRAAGARASIAAGSCRAIRTTSPWVSVLDLRMAQELPIFRKTRGILTFDIENFANLLNNDWGQLRQVSFPYVAPVVDAVPHRDGGLPERRRELLRLSPALGRDGSGQAVQHDFVAAVGLAHPARLPHRVLNENNRSRLDIRRDHERRPRGRCAALRCLRAGRGDRPQARTAAGEGEGPFDRLIIRNATVIDGTGAPPRGPVDVVVEGNRITAAVRGRRPPRRRRCARATARRARRRRSTPPGCTCCPGSSTCTCTAATSRRRPRPSTSTSSGWRTASRPAAACRSRFACVARRARRAESAQERDHGAAHVHLSPAARHEWEGERSRRPSRRGSGCARRPPPASTG